MISTLSAPEVVRCYFDAAIDPPLPVMCLRWPTEEAEPGEQAWELPEGVRLRGAPPREFGIRIQRQADDCYSVRLVWDRTCFSWPALTREQLLGGDLDALLSSLGTDLWYLLDQPPSPPLRTPRRAA